MPRLIPPERQRGGASAWRERVSSTPPSTLRSVPEIHSLRRSPVRARNTHSQVHPGLSANTLASEMGRDTTRHSNEHTFARANGQHTPCGFCARKSGNLCRPRCTFSPLPRDAGVKSLRKHHQHVCGSIDRSQLQQLRCRPCRFSCVHALRHRKQWLKCVHSGTGDLQGWKTSYHRPLEFAIGDDPGASPAASSANMLRRFTSDHAAMASRQGLDWPARRRTSAKRCNTGMRTPADLCSMPASPLRSEICACGSWPWALRSSQPHTATQTLHTRSTHAHNTYATAAPGAPETAPPPRQGANCSTALASTRSQKRHPAACQHLP